MRKNWMLALLCAALCAAMPAAARAHSPHLTHHTNRDHRAHKRVHHLHAASTDSAGTVTSFDGSALVVTLTNGSTVSEAVTNGTEMSCESPGQTTSMGSETRSDGGPAGRDDHGDPDDRGDRNDAGDNDEDDGNQMVCTTANLTPGTAVHEADLKISGAGSVWEKLDLINR